ncbi:MAG TPA: hypothetical protein DCZ76_09775 [Treponema sp.]|nr:hypothetical protein [Treponema sp.]
MSDLAYSYYNQLDTLDLPDLEILFDKISNLILSKKKNYNSEIENGLAFFDSIKGSVNREINEKEELLAAVDEKYACSN